MQCTVLYSSLNLGSLVVLLTELIEVEGLLKEEGAMRGSWCMLHRAAVHHHISQCAVQEMLLLAVVHVHAVQHRSHAAKAVG